MPASLARAATSSAGLALLIVSAVFGAAAAVDALWPDAQAPAAEPVAVYGAAQGARDLARLRCESCGVISAIRPFPAAAGAPAGVEFAVRLADGSVRLTTSRSQDSWLVGDRMRVMGGSAGRADRAAP
ncbi:MAG: hypothetical protein JWP22_28 [Ramlibacter sp.]|jgi:hypothetical protein|nr:hypothetical protein [Ramlibacter sp.]MDB5911353.1 hypothetical protein [Ramlibacter sp.]